jgi:hypothetical protein
VGEDRTGEPQTNQRLTVAEAAASLGITEGAVRSRIKRGTLATAKEGGTVFVLLGDGTSQANQAPNAGVPGAQSELIASLQDQVRYLRQQLDTEREARTEERRRHDTVVAQLTSKIPAIEAPSEVRESPESSDPTGGLREVRDELGTERARREMAESTLHEGMDEERRRREEAEQERDDLRRELHALREGPEAAEMAEEQQGRGQPRPAAGVAQEASEALGGRGSGTARGSLWRRIFGR